MSSKLPLYPPPAIAFMVLDLIFLVLIIASVGDIIHLSFCRHCCVVFCCCCWVFFFTLSWCCRRCFLFLLLFLTYRAVVIIVFVVIFTLSCCCHHCCCWFFTLSYTCHFCCCLPNRAVVITAFVVAVVVSGYGKL